jgi:hypothetical protein
MSPLPAAENDLNAMVARDPMEMSHTLRWYLAILSLAGAACFGRAPLAVGAEGPTVARRLVSNGFTDRYDDARQMLSDLPYDKWREYNAEDTVRFYALRSYEAGMIKSSPQKIIADSTNWRLLDELKRELKA